MRGDDDVGKGHQAGEHVVLNDLVGKIAEEEIGFFLVDIEAQRADAFVFEGLDDRAGVDDRAAVGVDQHDVWLDVSQEVGVDELVGLWGEWAVECDDVAGGGEVFQGEILDAERDAFIADDGVERDELAAEAAEDVGDAGADAAGADDPDGFFVHIEAEESVEGEVLLAHALHGAVQLAIQHEHEADGVFGDGVG